MSYLSNILLAYVVDNDMPKQFYARKR